MDNLTTALEEFGIGARTLAKLLMKSPPLTALDQLFIENHLHIVQVTCRACQHTHSLSDQDDAIFQAQLEQNVDDITLSYLS